MVEKQEKKKIKKFKGYEHFCKTVFGDSLRNLCMIVLHRFIDVMEHGKRVVTDILSSADVCLVNTAIDKQPIPSSIPYIRGGDS